MKRLLLGCVLGSACLLGGRGSVSAQTAAPPAIPVPVTSEPVVLTLPALNSAPAGTAVGAPLAVPVAAPVVAPPSLGFVEANHSVANVPITMAPLPGTSFATPPAAVRPAPMAPAVQTSVLSEHIVVISETDIGPAAAFTEAFPLQVPKANALPPASYPAAYPRTEQVGFRKSYIDLSAAPCFDHAADYTWIVGQVEYSSVAKEWRLRYLSVDETDTHGGRVSLIENHMVGLLREGMYVIVHGHLVNSDEGRHGPTYYHIDSFRAVDNPNVKQVP